MAHRDAAVIGLFDDPTMCVTLAHWPLLHDSAGSIGAIVGAPF